MTGHNASHKHRRGGPLRYESSGLSVIMAVGKANRKMMRSIVV